MFQNNVKIIIKKLVQHVNNMHHRHMFGADMKDKIKKSEVPILALSDEEKKKLWSIGKENMNLILILIHLNGTIL